MYYMQYVYKYQDTHSPSGECGLRVEEVLGKAIL